MLGQYSYGQRLNYIFLVTWGVGGISIYELNTNTFLWYVFTYHKGEQIFYKCRHNLKILSS